jgi:hypothetical protein
MSRIYIIHENHEWTAPLRAALDHLGLPYQEWFVDGGHIDLAAPPPRGVFYNRMSASSYSRGHRYAPDYTAAILDWLESHQRRVINSRRALQLEISKIAQYAALNAQGIRTPRTIAVAGRDEIVAAAGVFTGPFVTKHNRGGRGLGVRLFRNINALQHYIDSSDFEPPVDGITLVQEYIDAPEPFITRCEFIGGEFFYAVRVDTTQGFELCPADDCQLEDTLCSTTTEQKSKFQVVKGFEHPILAQYARFLRVNHILIAGIEFVVDRNGDLFTYDVNVNTNYNRNAEAEAGVAGMRAVATYLGAELRNVNESVQQHQAAVVS